MQQRAILNEVRVNAQEFCTKGTQLSFTNLQASIHQGPQAKAA